MLFGGIDPGKTGALAIIDRAGAIVQVMATPMVESATGRDAYDLMAISRELRVWHSPDAPLHVTVEKLHPLPPKMGGSIANFNRGVAHGWAWMLTGLGVPFLLVLPQVWQRQLLALPIRDDEDTKSRSIRTARALWPGLDLRRTSRARLDSDAFSDALLLAEFGRRRALGGAVFAAAARI